MRYHSYIFLSTNSTPSRKNYPEFLKLIEKPKNVIVYTYATLGFKVDTNIMLWIQGDSPEEVQDYINKLLHTNLGKNLKISYALFGLTRPTQYSPTSTIHLNTERKGGKYLVIYPFVKNKDWYQLTFENRKNLMWDHVKVGKKYPQVEQLLLYSFGVDDSEFIVSYEMDNLEDFQTLVMELRSDKVRNYTQSDTPIFTCIYKSPKEILNYL